MDAWNFSPNQQYNVQQSIVAQQIATSAQPAFTSIHPVTQQVNPSQLAEQMDNSLHISSTCV